MPAPGEPVFFEVVDVAARRKRQAQTASTQDIKTMAFPVSVQRYSVWIARAYPGQQHGVRPDGCPAVWDSPGSPRVASLACVAGRSPALGAHRL